MIHYDAEVLVGRLMDLETRYMGLQDHYQALIHAYEVLKEQYGTLETLYANRTGHRDQPSTRQDLGL